MHIVFAWMHTRAHAHWRIDKQPPGADKCSRSKQASLCLLHPTRPHLFLTAATNPATLHTQWNIWKLGVTPHYVLFQTSLLVGFDDMNHSVLILTRWLTWISIRIYIIWQLFLCCKHFSSLGLKALSQCADCSGSALVWCQRFLAACRRTGSLVGRWQFPYIEYTECGEKIWRSCDFSLCLLPVASDIFTHCSARYC